MRKSPVKHINQIQIYLYMRLLLYGNSRSKRAAAVDKDNRLIHYYEDFLINNNVKGNIYVGKITRIEPSLNAVFVDYGAKKFGFLSLFSIHPKYFNVDKKKYEEILQNLQKQTHLKNSDIYKKNKIQHLLQIGQKILVQIVRNEKENKGAMLSSFITIKGKYFKYIPTSISSKLILCDGVSEDQIEFLQEKFDALIYQKGSLSVSGTHKVPTKDILHDLNVVIHTWNGIKNTKVEDPGIIYEEDNFLNLINTILPDVTEIVLEGNINLKSLNIKQNQYSICHGFNIFQDLEKCIENLSQNIIQLPDGGYLILEQNQCCSTFDVNMGKFTKNKKSFARSMLETNINAIKEIFRQINLRNIGGIIIVDLIGTRVEQNITKLEQTIQEFKQFNDGKIDCSEISKFGILEICRQYTNNETTNVEKCQSCSNGNMQYIFIVAEQLIRNLQYLSEDNDMLDVQLTKELAEFIINHAMNDIEKIQIDLGVQINFKIIQNVNRNFYQITPTMMVFEDN